MLAVTVLEQKGFIRRGKQYWDHRVRQDSSAYYIQEQTLLSVSWGHAPTRGGGEIYEQGRQEQLSPSAAGNGPHRRLSFLAPHKKTVAQTECQEPAPLQPWKPKTGTVPPQYYGSVCIAETPR